MRPILGVFLFLFSSTPLLAQSPNDSLHIIDFPGQGHTYHWQKEWSVMIADAIDAYGTILLSPDSLPMEQIQSLYPGFAQAPVVKKKAFWIIVLAAMVKYESGFNPEARYKEPPPLNVYSEGLLQLSYGDETRYKHLPIDPAKKNIFDPAVNLTSGIIILSKQIRKKKTLFTEKHFYWSVLTNKQEELRAFITTYVEQFKICME